VALEIGGRNGRVPVDAGDQMHRSSRLRDGPHCSAVAQLRGVGSGQRQS
jgi:hypothetical protein